MLELVELGPMARRKPHQLSGGQQQRVALARALINRPQVLLLDEPLGALDLKLRRQMQIELKRIQTEVGITFVHVTHDQEEAMTMADTIAVMNGGRVEQIGAPERAVREPRAPLSSPTSSAQSNLIEAEVTAAERRGAAARGRGAHVRLPPRAAPPRRPHGRKVLRRRTPGEDLARRRADDAAAVRRRREPAHRPHHRRQLHRRLDAVPRRRPRVPGAHCLEQNVERDERLTPGADVVLHWSRPTPSPWTPPRTPTPARMTRRPRDRHRPSRQPPARRRPQSGRPGDRSVRGRWGAPPSAVSPRTGCCSGVLWLASSSSCRSSTWRPRRCRPARWRRASAHLGSPTYTDALADYRPQFLRSFRLRGHSDAACLLIGYPLAYTIAFKAGRWRNVCWCW